MDNSVLIYLHKILICSKTRHEHYEHIKIELKTIRNNKINKKLSKYEFFKSHNQNLKHVITKNRIEVAESKFMSVRDWDTPQSVTQVHCFLGFGKYYSRFIRSFATFAASLADLTKKTFVFNGQE